MAEKRNFKGKAKRTNNGNDKVKVNAKADAKRKVEAVSGMLIRPFEYNMPLAMANDYLADRKAH